MQLITMMLTIVGAGLSSYVAIRVALARIEQEQKAHGQELERQNERLNRLENRYFETK